MGKFFFKLTFLLSVAGLIALLYLEYAHLVIRHVMGPPTKEQIRESFENALARKYDLLILGSSRPYRGINPDKLSVPAYNFSHDNDSFNQAFYKLKYLQEQGIKPKYLVLGVDYFSFSFLSDTRNYAYAKYLDAAYLEDFVKEEGTFFDRAHAFDAKFNAYMGLNFTATVPQFLAGLLKIVTNKNAENLPYLKESGQYIVFGQAKPKDVTQSKAEILPIQEKYFERLLQACRQNNIQVVMVMLPSRPNELNSFKPEEKEKINQIYQTAAKENNFVYLNYATDSRFTMSDFTDITHLNREAADRFTTILDQDLKKYFR